MQRALVLGSSGAGKSTLSRRLAAACGLPLIELDFHYWQPGWTEPPREAWRARLESLIARPAWVMDGTFSGTLHLRIPRADTIVWLDYPRSTCLRRVVWRVVTGHGRTREGMADGCPEHIDIAFLRYIWSFNAVHRPRIVTAIDEFGRHTTLHRLTCDADAERLVTIAGNA